MRELSGRRVRVHVSRNVRYLLEYGRPERWITWELQQARRAWGWLKHWEWLCGS